MSFRPFLLELFWLRDVNEAKIVLGDEDEVVIEAVKAEVGLWEDLQRELSAEEKRQIRDEAIRESHEKHAKKAEDEIASKRDRELEAVSRSIVEDENRRNRIEAEKSKAKAEVFAYKKSSSGYSSSVAAKVAKEREKMSKLPPPRSEVVIKVDFSTEKGRVSSSSTSDLMKQGHKSFSDGDLAKAIEAFSEVIEVEPENGKQTNKQTNKLSK